MPEWSNWLLKTLVSEPNHAPAIVVHDLPPIFVDPANWEWNDTSVWKLAKKNWQDFKVKWYGAPPDLLVNPLSLDPLPSNVHDALPLILVRKSYVKMFDHVWAQAMSSEGAIGAIVTGQPGIGAYLLPTSLSRKINRVSRKVFLPVLPPCSASAVQTSRALFHGRRASAPLLP